MAGKNKKKKSDDNTIARNRKAYHDYLILEEWEAGIVLVGSEVKSLRAGLANLSDSYVVDEGDEMYLLNSYIGEYKQARGRNHEPKRKRKLLLHKSEINKIAGRLINRGLTVVPLSMYFNRKGIAKVKIGLAQGKAEYDKRDAEKKRDWDREKGKLLRDK